MPLTTFLRILQVVAIIESWCAAAWLFRRIKPKKGDSISRHGGTDALTYLVFAFTLSAHAVVFLAFVILWVGPHFHASSSFLIIALLAAILQFLTAWIRDGINPRLSIWHTYVAYGMAFTMPIMLSMLVASSRLPLGALAICWIALLGMLGLLTVPLSSKNSYGRYLYFQSAYIICFQFAIIALAFSS